MLHNFTQDCALSVTSISILSGKTIEDLRKRMRVEIVTDTKTAKKFISKPQFKGFHIIDKDIGNYCTINERQIVSQ